MEVIELKIDSIETFLAVTFVLACTAVTFSMLYGWQLRKTIEEFEARLELLRDLYHPLNIREETIRLDNETRNNRVRALEMELSSIRDMLGTVRENILRDNNYLLQEIKEILEEQLQ